LPKLLDALQTKMGVPLPPALTAGIANIKMALQLKCEPGADGLHVDLTLPVTAIKAAVDEVMGTQRDH